MTEVLLVSGWVGSGDISTRTASRAECLTARGRSRRLPRHEEDLSTEEGQEKPDARFPAAFEDARWQERHQAPSGQGPQTAHAERSEEVGGRSGVRLGKAARLTLRNEFLAVQGRGMKVHAGAYIVLALPNGLGRPRLGVTVSTRIGKAVLRSQVKRWVREAFRANAADLPAVDLVVIARSSAREAGLGGAQRALTAARELGSRR